MSFMMALILLLFSHQAAEAKQLQSQQCPLFVTASEKVFGYCGTAYKDLNLNCSCSRSFSGDGAKFDCETMNKFQSRFSEFNNMKDMYHCIDTWKCMLATVANHLNLSNNCYQLNSTATQCDYNGTDPHHEDTARNSHTDCGIEYEYIAKEYIYLYDVYNKMTMSNFKHKNVHPNVTQHPLISKFIQLNNNIVIESRKFDFGGITSWMFRGGILPSKRLFDFLMQKSKADIFDSNKRLINITIIGISSGEDVVSLYYQICQMFEKFAPYSMKNVFYNMSNWKISIYSMDINMFCVESMQFMIDFDAAFPCYFFHNKDTCEELNDFLFYQEYRQHIVLQDPIWANVARIKYSDQWYARNIIQHSQYVQANFVMGSWSGDAMGDFRRLIDW